MPRPEQSLKEVRDTYDKWGLIKEIDNLHRRLNDLFVVFAAADLKTNYAVGELDTEAKIVTALNATNTRINQILEKIRSTTG